MLRPFAGQMPAWVGRATPNGPGSGPIVGRGCPNSGHVWLRGTGLPPGCTGCSVLLSPPPVLSLTPHRFSPLSPSFPHLPLSTRTTAEHQVAMAQKRAPSALVYRQRVQQRAPSALADQYRIALVWQGAPSDLIDGRAPSCPGPPKRPECSGGWLSAKFAPICRGTRPEQCLM